MTLCNTSVTNKKYVSEPSVPDQKHRSDSKIIGLSFTYIPNLKMDIYKLKSCNASRTYYINGTYCAKSSRSDI